MTTNKVWQGDCLKVMKSMESNSVDAIVTDPPYFLINNNGAGFMNKEWDGIMNLWKYQWADNSFANFAVQLLKSTLVDRSTGVGSIAHQNVNMQGLKRSDISNASSVKTASTIQTKNNASAHLLVLTKQEVLGLLPEKSYVHTNVIQYLDGVQEDAQFAIPLLPRETVNNTFVAKTVTALCKADGCEATTTTFTKTALAKISHAIEVMIGTSFELPYTNEMAGSADIVVRTVSVSKYKLTTLSPIEKQKITQSLTLLLCAYHVTRTSSNIQTSLIKTFFRVIFQEANRVLKPGGHVIAFAGSRTYQWLATAIEESNYEIRDQILYLYGSGFPKALDIEKAGGGPEWHGWKTALKPAHEPCVLARKPIEGTVASNCLKWGVGGINIDGCRVPTVYKLQGNDLDSIITICQLNHLLSPANSVELKNFQDDMTSLISQMSSVLEYVDTPSLEKALGTRLENTTITAISCSDETSPVSTNTYLNTGTSGNLTEEQYQTATRYITSTVEKTITDWKISSSLVWQLTEALLTQAKKLQSTQDVSARFPANLIHDGSDEVVELFPNTSPSKAAHRGIQQRHDVSSPETARPKENTDTIRGHDDNGGSAARFFYCAKASKAERNRGCEGLEEKIQNNTETNSRTFNDRCFTCKKKFVGSYATICHCPPELKITDKTVYTNKNNHPTVKPIALMEYLVKLVSREGAVVLDPFAGSGSTLIACKNLNRQYIGIEMDGGYVDIINARLDSVKPKQMELV